MRFGLFPVRSPLLGESLLFSFPAGTKMFQFPALAPHIRAVSSFRTTGCPIRRSADHRPFAPTRGFSQLTTSFIASVSQGIHHAPLLSFPFSRRDDCAPACLACANMSKIFSADRNTAEGSRVENNGLEPLTPCLQGRRSSQLS